MCKKCPICGDYIDDGRTICEFCEMEYDGYSAIEKRPKGHVVDGGDWWRIQRTNKGKKGA